MHLGIVEREGALADWSLGADNITVQLSRQSVGPRWINLP
jgi:hypothetical protein